MDGAGWVGWGGNSEFLSIEEGNSYAAMRAIQDAVRFLADSRVCEWLAEANATKGVAPSSADVHSRFAFEVNRILHGRLECELVATPFLSLAQTKLGKTVTMEGHESMHQAEGGVAVR